MSIRTLFWYEFTQAVKMLAYVKFLLIMSSLQMSLEICILFNYHHHCCTLSFSEILSSMFCKHLGLFYPCHNNEGGSGQKKTKYVWDVYNWKYWEINLSRNKQYRKNTVFTIKISINIGCC